MKNDKALREFSTVKQASTGWPTYFALTAACLEQVYSIFSQ